MLHLVVGALSFSLPPSTSTRRDVISLAAGAIAAMPFAANAVSARSGLSSVFTGEYDDPNHPGCLRSVKVVGAKRGADGRVSRNPTAYVSGVDGLPKGTKSCGAGVQPTLADVWKTDGKVSEDGQTISIDVRELVSASSLLPTPPALLAHPELGGSKPRSAVHREDRGQGGLARGQVR